MDPHHRIHTRATFRLVRAEALLALAALCYLLAAFAHDVHWGRFLIAFALIDLIGYLPGALAYRRQLRRKDRPSCPDAQPPDPHQTAAPAQGAIRIAPIYHHLYNLAHSFLTTAAVIAVWFACTGDVEWAMLALPVHLLGDRGLFGNTYKPASLPFEPAPVPSVPSAQSGHSPSLVPPRRAGSHAPAGAPISIAQPGVP